MQRVKGPIRSAPLARVVRAHLRRFFWLWRRYVSLLCARPCSQLKTVYTDARSSTVPMPNAFLRNSIQFIRYVPAATAAGNGMLIVAMLMGNPGGRSEERRVGKERRARWW